MTLLVLLIVTAVVAYRLTTPEQRAMAVRTMTETIGRVRNHRRAELAPFHEALGARRPLLLFTPAIVALNIGMWAAVSFDHSGRSNSELLVAWGASIGPRTTNGEWWRLVASLGLQPGLVALAVASAATLQAGRILERLVGPLAVAAVFLAAGLLGGITTLTLYPLQVSAGASSALVGLYSMLGVAAVIAFRRQAELTIPLVALKRGAWVAGAVIIVDAVDGAGSLAADVVGLSVGVACGIALLWNAADLIPGPRRVGIVFGAAAIAAAGVAIPLRGILDVQPELARLPVIERETTHLYETAAVQVRRGAMSAETLAAAIDDTIVPLLRAVDDRFADLKRVPREHEPKIVDARRYLQLRTVSWTLRAQSLREGARPIAPSPGAQTDSGATFRALATARHRTSELTRGKAEAAEREALDALGRLKPAAPAAGSSN